MGESNSVFSRIGKWFRKPDADANGLLIDPPTDRAPLSTDLAPMTRTGLFGVFRVSRRDQAIANLQQGFSSLTDLMGAIKENLEQQNQRQQELVEHLSALPRVLEMIPDSTRMHGETLKAIHEQISNHGEQQVKLAEILEKVGDHTGAQRETLDALHERVDQLHQHESKISDNLHTVGAAMESVTKNTHTTSQVLETMRDNLSTRDGELERILHRQGNRFTVLMSVAIFLSVVALTAVAFLAYLILNKR